MLTYISNDDMTISVFYKNMYIGFLEKNDAYIWFKPDIKISFPIDNKILDKGIVESKKTLESYIGKIIMCASFLINQT